ncbi:MAG: hypothetical protein E7164_02230 [Firmicutes bacterium]|nr:hypothetical protein [Bacillota bacterium]
MNEIEIIYNDGSKKKFPKYTTYYEISKSFNMPHKIVGAMVNNKIISLYDKAETSGKVEFLDITSTNGNRIYTAGLKMIFEYAVKRVLPDVKVEFSYSLPKSIIAELVYNRDLNDDDISVVLESMSNIIKSNKMIEKLIVKNADGIAYYEELGNNVKADNIRNIVDSTVVLYRLDDLINYYYSEMPYSTGVIDTYSIHYLGKNLVAINYPTVSDQGNLPEYIDYQGVIDSYVKGKKWLEIMKVPYINDVNAEICKGKIANFIKSCELNFNLEINEAAKYISHNSNIKCVMIAGPSTSGKTTVTKRIANYFEIYGLDPITISVDDYFHDNDKKPRGENGDYDFECLEAIDLEYLARDVVKLFNGEEVFLPRFNFINGRKELSSKKIKLKENSIIIFEGLHAINDRLLPMIPNSIKYKIYVSPYIPLCLDEHNYISCGDLRLIRRIVRDFRTRGFNPEGVIKHNIKVKAGENKHVIPFINQADKIINTSLAYEVGALKVYVEPLLFSIPSDSDHYNEARRLLSFMKQFFTISSEYIPNDSILREFIGGDNND